MFLLFTVEANHGLIKMEEKLAFVPYNERTEPSEKLIKRLGVFAEHGVHRTILTTSIEGRIEQDGRSWRFLWHPILQLNFETCDWGEWKLLNEDVQNYRTLSTSEALY